MVMKYDERHVSSFIKGLTTLIGLSQKKLKKYADENNLFNVLEHPNTIEPNKQQLEKISLLNEFIASYKLLKMHEEENKLTLNSSVRSGEYFASLLSGTKDKEKFMVAFLDNGNNIIETRTMSEGSVGEAVVYPRHVLKAALDCDCKAIVLAHNHPGGSLKPSQQDKEITLRLTSIFTPLQINVLDHIIVANTKYYSMAEQGVLPDASPSKVSYEAIPLNNQEGISEELESFNSELGKKNNGEIENSKDWENSYHNYDLDLESEDEDEWEM